MLVDLTFNAIKLIPLAGILFACSVAVYRLYIHPLSKHPGPRLAALSDWYAAYFASSGQLHWKIHSWHQQYGPILRVGPNMIVFNEHESFKQVYAPNPNLVKSTRYAAVSASHTPNLVSSNHQPTVNMKRKAHLDMWNNRSLKKAEPRLHDLIDTLLSLMAPGGDEKTSTDSWSPTIDLSELGTRFGFDAMLSMGTGENPNVMLSPDKYWMPAASLHVSWRAITASFQPKLYKWNLDKMILAPAYKEIMGLGKYYWQATKTRAEQGVTGSQDLIDVMMQTKDEKRGLEFSTKELWLEVFLLGAVGSTSIGPFISAIFSLLLHSPAKLDRLTAEIRSLSSSEEIRIDGQLDHCSYLWACVDELFRLMPVINNALFRTVQKGGVVINNTFYPEGTDLGSSIFEINRNEKYFEDPHEFKPERYLGGSEEERKEAKKYWVPFGKGNRTCVGQTLAYVITVQAVAKVIWEYDVRLAPEACCGSVPEEKLASHHNFDSFIGIRTSGPLIQVRKR